MNLPALAGLIRRILVTFAPALTRFSPSCQSPFAQSCTTATPSSAFALFDEDVITFKNTVSKMTAKHALIFGASSLKLP